MTLAFMVGLNFKLKTSLIQSRIDRPVSEQLRTQTRLNPHTLFLRSEAERIFPALHLGLQIWQKSLHSIKEWANYGVFSVRGFGGSVFGDE
jgi:hypothetical protein